MIAGLRGRLEGKATDASLVDVGGVVYRVGTSATTLAQVGDAGETVRLHTYLFVREDQRTLYGFAIPEELRLFETLIGVTGVGPRLACAVLSHIRTDLLYDAIAREDAGLLGSVPGVGRKTAARLILELRGKLVPAGIAPSGAPSRDDAEVVEALKALGYTAAEAHGAVAALPRDPAATVDDRLMAALRELARGWRVRSRTVGGDVSRLPTLPGRSWLVVARSPGRAPSGPRPGPSRSSPARGGSRRAGSPPPRWSPS